MRLKDIIRSSPVATAAIVVLAAAAGITWKYVPWLSAAEACCLIALIVAVLIRSNKQYRAFIGRINTLNSTLETGGTLDSENIRAFPLPVALCSADGRILWFNKIFADEISALDGFDDLDMNSYCDLRSAAQAGVSSVDAGIGDSLFTVWISRVSDDLCALYFIDDTALKNTRQDFLRTRPVVCMISIDSLDHASEVFSHVDYASITADIEKLIASWFNGFSCIFRKFSDGRFIAVTESENYERMRAAKFDILDKVRGYTYNGEHVDATLSVGAGREDTFFECEKSARLALDMARGRGGDQVAVKTSDSYDFIGGVSAGRERHSRTQSRLIAAALCELIASSGNVIVMGHSFSDFDCMGSAIGLMAICRSKNVKCRIVYDADTSLASPLCDLFLGSEDYPFVDYNTAMSLTDENTLLIITDNQRPSTLDCRDIFDVSSKYAVIDHHRMTVDHITDTALLFHEPQASSASEMVTELIEYAPSKPTLSGREAEALLAGIILDTKNFTLRSGVRTFEAAAYLRDMGANTVTVKKLFSSTPEHNRLVNNIVSSAKFFGNYAVAVTDIKDPSIKLLCSTAADELLNIKGVDASFVIFNDGSAASVSARSWGEVNVQLIMEALGGGGHQNMAAAQLHGVSLLEAREKLHEAVGEYQKNNAHDQ